MIRTIAWLEKTHLIYDRFDLFSCDLFADKAIANLSTFLSYFILRSAGWHCVPLQLLLLLLLSWH